MSAIAFVLILLKLSLLLTMFSVGLGAHPRDLTYLLRAPGLLARSMIAMYVVVPVLALAMSMALAVPNAVKIALVASALSPMPPFLVPRASTASGEPSYAVALAVTSGIASLLVAPLGIWIVGRLIDAPLHVSPVPIARIVATTIVIPLLAGMGARLLWNRFADWIAEPTRRVGLVLLVGGGVGLLGITWRPMLSLIGNGTVLAILALALAAAAAGHRLGGPNAGDRKALSLASASRHPAVAVAIAQATYPEQKAAPAAIVLLLIIAALAPMLTGRRRRRASKPDVVHWSKVA